MIKTHAALRSNGRIGRTVRIVTGAAMLLAATVLGLVAMSATPAGAKVIAGAITGVTVTPPNPGIFSPVTVNATWCVPNGSMQGDTFTLQLPPQLTPYTTGFPVKDRSGNLIATAAVSNGVVTFTLTDYAQTHNGVCGSAFFNEAIVSSQVTSNQPTTLEFNAGGTIFRTTITPTKGTGVNRTVGRKYGSWNNKADQGRTNPKDALEWYMDSPVALAPNGDTSVVFTDTTAAGQAFDCNQTSIHIGTFDASGNFVSTGIYGGAVTKSCTPSMLTITTGAVPPRSALHLAITVSITDQSLTSFSDSGSVSVNGQGPQKVTAGNVVRFDSGGSGSGTVPTPSTPASSPSTPASSPSTPSSSPPIIVRTSSGGPATTTPATTKPATSPVVATTTASAILASTGSNTGSYTLIGVGLLAVGGALLLGSARWKRGTHTL